MSDIFKDIKKMAEQGVKDQTLQTLKTDGFEIECANCKQSFIARKIKAVCPNCSETTEITFNFK